MDPDLSPLDDHLEDRDVDGYLLDADSDDADQRYLSGFDAPDPFVTLYDGDVHLLMTRSLEYGRAKREARAATVERDVDYGFSDLRSDYGPYEARHRTLARFLEAYDVNSVATPPRFPLGTADGLREQEIEVAADDESVITEVRARKTTTEIEHIRRAQRANEKAMARAESLIANAAIDDDRLVADGDVLTSERVREEIELTLIRNGCALSETIVASGPDAADPHERGTGPLKPHEPIIVDIFPRDAETHYHADMTRTFCRGEPSETIQEWYDLTRAAQAAALAAIEPGIPAGEVHGAACSVYEDAGRSTLRSDDSAETGFIHSTGHGVGLAVHELPRVSEGGQELEEGHVITIEPGLYDPAVGGVRIEDLVVVTGDGYENLTDYEMEFVVGK